MRLIVLNQDSILWAPVIDFERDFAFCLMFCHFIFLNFRWGKLEKESTRDLSAMRKLPSSIPLESLPVLNLLSPLPLLELFFLPIPSWRRMPKMLAVSRPCVGCSMTSQEESVAAPDGRENLFLRS